jgi:hypothetical protein
MPWPDISPFGSTWSVEGLAAGETLVLETLFADEARSNLLRFAEPGTYTLYALVDSYGDTSQGNIDERSEENNLSPPVELTVRTSEIP